MSLDAQRQELHRFARSKGLAVAGEYADAVESAKTEDRPGFQRLLIDLKSSRREWDTILALDTSRISRRQYFAHVFEHECAKRGVRILFAKVPEADPITDMVIKGVLRVFDELHSLMSREKGLAGMAENIRQGYRAGGRAPRGYQLERIDTGTVRDGEPVTKSRLVPGRDAERVKGYLEDRAAGIARKRAAEKHAPPGGGLVDMEWNALVYAGCLVWNMRRESGHPDGKRRPRNEWVVLGAAHEPLISRAAAEAILHRLETSARSKPRQCASQHLLGGLLEAPDGRRWWSDGRHAYRLKPGHTIAAAKLDKAVLAKLQADLCAPRFIRELTATARNAHRTRPAEAGGDDKKRLRELAARIDKLMDLAAQMADPAPSLRKIDALERERRTLEARVTAAETQAREWAAAANITEHQVKRIIEHAVLDADDREALKDTITQLVERIVLDPDSRECQIHYRIRVASPRGGALSPVLRLVARVA